MARLLPPKKPNTGSIKRSASLLRKLVYLLLIISVTVIVLMIQKYVTTRQNISIAVIEQLTEETELRFLAFFRPITINASVIKRWALSGDIDSSKPGELTNRFIPILEQLPQIHSIIFASDIGLEFSEYVEFVLKELDGKKILVINCRNASQPAFLKHKKDEQFFIRSGPSSRQLTTSQVIEYLKDR